MLLGNDAEISLSVLDEIHLLVYLCSVVYPSAPKSELVSGFSPWNGMTRFTHTGYRPLGTAVMVASTQQFWVWQLGVSGPPSGCRMSALKRIPRGRMRTPQYQVRISKHITWTGLMHTRSWRRLQF